MPKFLVAIVFVASTLAVPASAQVLIETGALSSPKKVKDLGDIWDRAMKEPGAKPAAKPAAKPGAARAATVPAKPKVLPETFSGNTEDAMSILDINPDAHALLSSNCR